jgi:hypothetical protein
MDGGMWPFSTFITLAIPIGGGLGWLVFNRKEIYKKLFFPLIILVGVFFILSAVWDLSSSVTMAAVTPYIELDKFNNAEAVVYSMKNFSGTFVLNCIVTSGYLYLLRWFAEADNKKRFNKILGLAGLDNKEPLTKKRGKNKRSANKRKR